MNEKIEKPRTTNTLIAIGIVVLLVMVFRINNRVSRLESSVHNVNNNQMTAFHDIRMTSSQIWELTNRFDIMNSEIIQATSPSFNHQINIQNFDTETAVAEILISFNLREFAPGDMITINAINAVGQNFSTEATTSLDGRFFAYIDLPVYANYILTFTATGDMITTGELMRLDIENMLSGRFGFFANPSVSSWLNHPTRVTLWPSFTNHARNDPSLGLKELVLSLEIDDEVVQTWDLMPYLLNIDGEHVLRINEDLFFDVDTNEDIYRDATQIITRLHIIDNLGIEYEQVDIIFMSHWHDRSWASELAGVAPVPSFQFSQDFERMGRVLIVR